MKDEIKKILSDIFREKEDLEKDEEENKKNVVAKSIKDAFRGK